jgi:hypothetical protein
MYFGGALNQIGWLLLGFGSIFFWAFTWHADLSGWNFREGAVERVPGRVLSCRDTKYSVGGSDTAHGTPVYENRYRYEVGGRELEGVSYATGRCLPGARVTVEYPVGRPEYSRIEGMRRGLLGPWALLMALLPAVGLLCVIAGLRKGGLCGKLLREGLPVAGAVTAKFSTGSSTMGKRDYRVVVEFETPGQRSRKVMLTTNHPEDLDNGLCTMVLYDPENPTHALPIGGMPGTVTEDESGSFTGNMSWNILVLPALSLIGNGWYIWRHVIGQ